MIILKNGESIYNAPISPMLTIIDDDGHKRFYTDVVPIIQSKNVPIACSLIGRNIGVASSYMTWEQVDDAYSKGAEMINHTYQHYGEAEETRTSAEIFMDYQKNARLMYSHGIYTGNNILVYPGGSAHVANVQVASKQFSFGAFHSSGNKNNDIGTDVYNILRYRIDTDYHYDVTSLENLIDNCVRGWMVWVIHTSGSDWTNYSGASAIASAIDYAKSKSIPIVTAEYGIKKLRGIE